MAIFNLQVVYKAVDSQSSVLLLIVSLGFRIFHLSPQHGKSIKIWILYAVVKDLELLRNFANALYYTNMCYVNGRG
jgi:hypothetical protein